MCISIPIQSNRSKWRLLTRKERWGLSWQGRLLVTVVVPVIGWFILWTIYPFLAVTHRVNANVLVVEGWIHEYAIRAAVAEFQSHRYERVFTTGGPVAGSGGYTNDYNTSASVGADLLSKWGLPGDRLQMVPSRVMDRDRTYGSAVALRNWLRDHNVAISRINVVTEDLHARRTRLLFQRALEEKVAVGVISIPSPDYDARRWWCYSEGLKNVVSEAAAYVYARLFFYPSRSSPDERERPVLK